MGSFYTNFTLKTTDVAGVHAGLKKSQRSALVTPASNGYVVVYDEESDQQDTAAIEELGAKLSADSRCPVLAILNHDDDILCYWLFDAGVQTDAYNSAPDYWDESAGTDRGGNADLLCQTLGKPEAAARVKAILYDKEYVFALERHADLVEALDLPQWSVGIGFNYAGEGDMFDDLKPDDLLQSP